MRLYPLSDAGTRIYLQRREPFAWTYETRVLVNVRWLLARSINLMYDKAEIVGYYGA